MPFLEHLVDVLPFVNSPLTLIGFLAVVAVLAFSIFHLKQFDSLAKSLKDLPQEKIAIIIEKKMGEVIPSEISAEQWLKGRRHKYYFLAFISLLAFIIVVVGIQDPSPPIENQNEEIFNEYFIEAKDMAVSKTKCNTS